jgi:hypothetical protein
MIPEAVIPAALINLLIAAVIVAAVAMVLQAIFMYGTYRSSAATKEQVFNIATHAESLVSSIQQAVEQSRKQIVEVSAKAGEVLDLTHKQLVRIDEVLGEATARARIQMDRVEMILDDTASRVQETTRMLHNGILRPLREINGVAAGVRAAVEYLMRARRPTVDQATHDEEMFI